MITMTEPRPSASTRVVLGKCAAYRASKTRSRPNVAAEQTSPASAAISLRKRAKRLRIETIEFMDHPAFHREGLGLPSELQPALDANQSLDGRASAPAASSAGTLAGLVDTPLLDKAQEAFLFCRMNYLKYRAASVLEQLDPANPRARLIEQIERFLSEALEIRNHLIRANLRLIVFIAKDFVDRHHPLPELVSDGTIALMRAVEKFDFARGNRFSTYATWAVRNHFIRVLQTNRKRLQRHLSGYQESLDSSSRKDGALPHSDTATAEKYEYIEDLLEQLSERERVVITGRFALTVDGKKRTLEEIGDVLGISKERVRQISERALGKLRELAQSRPPELLDLLLGDPRSEVSQTRHHARQRSELQYVGTERRSPCSSGGENVGRRAGKHIS